MTDDQRAMETTIRELVTALVHTVEYVGVETLNARPGWSWYDVLAKHELAALESMLPRPDEVITAHQRMDAGSCVCGWGEGTGDLGRSHSAHVWDMLQRHGVTGPNVRRGEPVI